MYIFFVFININDQNTSNKDYDQMKDNPICKEGISIFTKCFFIRNDLNYKNQGIYIYVI